MIFVDGVELGEMADVALRDRRMLSADGIFIVVVTIAEQDGRSVADPEVIFRGVPFLDEADELEEEIRLTVEETLARAAGEQVREVDVLTADSCTTTWRSWSMTASSAGRWCSRSSSRSSGALDRAAAASTGSALGRG